MKLPHPLPLTIAFAFLSAAVITTLAQQPAPGAARPSPEYVFQFLDANHDGRLSEEEFARLKDYSPYFRQHPDRVSPVFHELDSTGVGSLSLDEFRKLYDLRKAREHSPAKSETAAPPAAASTAANTPPTADGIAFFEKKIRPILAEKCYKCHAADSEKIKGGLVLDTREGIRQGGDTGPAVVPGDTTKSLLVEALHYGNKDLQMPPEKQGGKLPDDVIANFEKWIAIGAPDPREREAAQPAATKSSTWNTEKAKDHWAFKIPQRQPVPAVKDASWPQSDLDRFVLAQLESKDLKPVTDASPRALMRRITFDLTGLPPAPEEVDKFVQDAAQDRRQATAGLVDRLLASPRFGERWGRHWLDVARYAESTGRDVNCTLPHAWRYRDYVIAAFNADKPYDRFIREQIAGDLLPAKDNHERAENQIATGFLALGSRSLAERNQRQFALDMADEQIDTVTQAVLGLTVACARCHDHKFDPIPQGDYYALAGIFLSTETLYGTAATFQNPHPTSLIELPTDCGLPRLPKTLSAEQRAQKERSLAAALKAGERVYTNIYAKAVAGTLPGGFRGDAKNGIMINASSVRIRDLEADLSLYEADGRSKLLAMGVEDLPAHRPAPPATRPRTILEVVTRYNARPPEFAAIGDSALYARGDVAKPSGKVPRGFLGVLTHGKAPAIPATESGRRELAEWLVAPDNALTSRVFVNRAWNWLFGRGLVESVDNFGVAGQAPANPALLDYLALRFQDEHWSVKSLIREILLSRTYQLGSTYDEKNFTADPEDSLVWRMSPRRLDAECIRDAMLSVSGALQLDPPIGSPVAYTGDGSIGGIIIRSLRPPLSDDPFLSAAGDYRSVYLPVPRAAIPDSLTVFDFAEPSMVTGHRDTTTAPSQALYVLNNTFVSEQSRRFAQKVMAAPKGQRINRAFQLAFARPPTSSELQSAKHFFDGYPAANDGGATAWAGFCRALFGSAEFRMLD